MKKFIYALSIAAAAFTVQSCGDSLTDFNVDINNPTEVALNLQLPDILVKGAFNEGTNPNRVAGVVMQQFVGIDAQQLAYNAYIMGGDVMDNYWNSGLYSGVLRSCDVIIKASAERPFYGAVAKVVMANELGKATSFFGDLPYSEAFQGTDGLKPVYDKQEAIYATVQSLLDEAIAAFEGGTATGYNGGDLVGGGDTGAWAKVAHGLKARYLTQTGKRSNGNYALAAAEAAKSFASNAEVAAFQFESSETANWALAKFAIERPTTLGVDARFATMMDADPRQAKMMSFDGTQWNFFDAADGELVWGRSDARVPLVSYVELQFIMAENAARNGGDVTTPLTNALTASFDMLGAEDDGYIATASADGSLENVMTEAYKAYFGFNFHETWANWRRTGIPALTPSSSCGDNGFNPSCAVPQRYLYVESEDQTNSASVAAAKASQGGALLDATLWVFE